MTEGTKHDGGKLDLSLLDYDLIEPLIEVLTLGEKRYTFENWKKDFGPNYRRRFRAAMRRHDRSSAADSLARNEQDGNVYHLAQVAINALFELYHAKREEQLWAAPILGPQTFQPHDEDAHATTQKPQGKNSTIAGCIGIGCKACHVLVCASRTTRFSGDGSDLPTPG